MTKQTLAARLYRLAARSFPADVRASHGAEIVETALEFGDGRFSVREAGSLFAQGLRARARHGLRGDASSLVISALRIGLFLFALDSLVLTTTAVLVNVPGMSLWWIPISLLVPAIMLMSTGGKAFLLQLLVAVAGWTLVFVDTGTEHLPVRFVIASTLPWIGLAVVAWRGDGRRVMSPAAGLAIYGIAVALAWSVGPGGQIPFVPTPTMALLALIAIATAISPFDPRLAAGAACFLSLTAFWSALNWSINQDLPLRGVERELVWMLGIAVIVVGALVVASRRSNRHLTRL